jgi:hypothetical protein
VFFFTVLTVPFTPTDIFQGDYACEKAFGSINGEEDGVPSAFIDAILSNDRRGAECIEYALCPA